jgi:PLP dependent protein
VSFVKPHLEKIHQAIAELAPQRKVRIIAVTKTVGLPPMREAIAAGIVDIGENRLQEALAKLDQDPLDGICRHFIGPIQSNKLKKMAAAFHWFHALDSEKTAAALAQLPNPPLTLVQINSSGEISKHGLKPEDLPDFLKSLQKYPTLPIRGLMTIGPNTKDESAIRASFRLMSDLRKACRPFETEHIQLQELSMGMSGDYRLALQEGASMLRIGTYLFGERNG